MLRGFALRSVPRLRLDTRSAQRVFCHAQVAAKNFAFGLPPAGVKICDASLKLMPFRHRHLVAAVVVFVLRVFSHAASPRGSPVLFHVLRRRSESAARAAGFPAYGHAAVHLNLCHSATAISSQRLLYSFSACFPTRLPRAGALFYFMSCGGEVNPPLAPPDFRRMATRLFT